LQEKIASVFSAQVTSSGIQDSKAKTIHLVSTSVIESQTFFIFKFYSSVFTQAVIKFIF